MLVGGLQIKTKASKKEECYVTCLQKKIKGHAIDGVNWKPTSKQCFCVSGQQSIDNDEKYATCLMNIRKADLIGIPMYFKLFNVL